MSSGPPSRPGRPLAAALTEAEGIPELAPLAAALQRLPASAAVAPVP
ncbi:hypothetical protein [Spongiactinospora sp. 9N601]